MSMGEDDAGLNGDDNPSPTEETDATADGTDKDEGPRDQISGSDDSKD